MEKLFVLLVAFVFALPLIVRADAKEDREAVKQAVLDYVEGIYEVDPARIERSVHPDIDS
ncbi:MAG TPA: nuclear transport factor 2 family protein [Blastocatellia bacterium]|nr:nuclear transport factor 2 family protein [Blastocatellia bacterium]